MNDEEIKVFILISVIIILIAVRYDIYRNKRCESLNGVMVRGVCLKDVKVIN